ncbi:hypothetical protein [Loktanella sp. R86503]|uniref:hypothetical protein n=1 Tax=Loktanella sp. R86503 TaxID=3093847 RepID=UPI0036D9D598
MVTETERIAILLQLENDQFEKKAQSAAKSIQRMEQRFDPLAKAAQRFEREQLQVNRALAAGKIDADRAAKLMDNLNAEYQQATAGATAFANSNAGLTNVLQRNKNVAQQLGYQVGDFAVQVQGGTSAITAFTQQGTQMLGVFGAYGAIAGAILAVGAPVIASFMSSGDAAETYGDAIEELQASLDAYKAAADLAGMSTDDLTARFGDGASALQGQLDLLRILAMKAALQDAQTAAASLTDEFGGLFTAIDQGGHNGRNAIARMTDEFGLSKDQALSLRDALDSIGAARGPGEIADASTRLNDMLIAIYGSAWEIPPQFDAMAEAAANAARVATELDAAIGEVHNSTLDAVLAAYEIGEGIYSALPSADTLLIRMREVAGAAWDAAAAFTAAQNAEAKAALAAKLAPLGDDERGTQTDQVQSAGEFRGQQNLGVANARSSSYLNPSAPKKASGGGSKSKGSGSTKTETPFYADVERDIQALERQIETIGKTSAEIAEMKARYDLLDEAKKRGIAVTDELTQRINAEAAEVGRLTGEYEAAQDQIAALEGLNESWKDSIIDAAMGGADAFDQFKDAIKRAAIEYAIFGTGTFANIGGGGGGLGGLAGAAMNAFGGFRANGGSVSSGKSYVVGERGPELFTPPSGGKIIPNNKLGGGRDSGGAMQVTVGVSADNNGNLMPFVQSVTRNGVQQGMGQLRKEVPGIVSRHTKVSG